jgi:hypothetical protein
MAKEVKYCGECGRPLTKRWISLSAKMVQGLRFCATYTDRPMPLRELGEYFGGTQTTAYQEFHNLRYFGLVEWAEGKGSGWRITQRGEWFLADEDDVPRRVRVFDSQVIETDPQMIGITQVPKIKMDIERAREQMDPLTNEEAAANVDRRRDEGEQ